MKLKRAKNGKSTVTAFETCVDIGFLEGFLCDADEIASVIDRKKDDMIAFGLYEKSGNVYYVKPDGNCCADIYKLNDLDSFEILMNYINSLKKKVVD